MRENRLIYALKGFNAAFTTMQSFPPVFAGRSVKTALPSPEEEIEKVKTKLAETHNHRGYVIERLGWSDFAIRFNGRFVGFADSWVEAGRMIDHTVDTDSLIARVRA